jgi:hypothetical protein
MFNENNEVVCGCHFLCRVVLKDPNIKDVEENEKPAAAVDGVPAPMPAMHMIHTPAGNAVFQTILLALSHFL